MSPIHHMIPDFKPSTKGLQFKNYYDPKADIHLFTFDILGKKVPFGEASKGVCGGMVYAVMDYYEAGSTPPREGTKPPTSGPLFDHIARRLFASFNLSSVPPGPLKYYNLMNPNLSEGETWASRKGLAPHGRAWVMIEEEWPKIKADLDANHLSPLGLIQVKSDDPFKMGENHQVLSYGYALSNNDLTLHIYDPNHPDEDDVTLSLNISDPEHETKLIYSVYAGRNQRVWCFFRSDYTFSFPPLSEGVTKNIRLKASNGQNLWASWLTKKIIANGNKSSAGEIFQLIDQNHSPLTNGDPVALRARNERYVGIHESDPHLLMAKDKVFNAWKAFTILRADGSEGEITSGQQIALRANNGMYVCAEGGGGRELVANRSVIGPWETFTLEMAD